jgi:Gpi18-like mannosyltransferase
VRTESISLPTRTRFIPRIGRQHPLFWLVIAALAVRLALTPLYAHLPDGALDEGYWKYWMYHIQDGGILNIFRTTDTDYVGYQWVLWLLAGVYGVIGDGTYNDTTPLLHMLVKMPSIVFDVALILVVYHATRILVRENLPRLPLRQAERGSVESRSPLIAAAVIAFQPAVVYDSAVWAQTDSAITAAMLGAIVLAHTARPALSGAAYALGLAVKPQPIIVGPLLLLALLRSGGMRAAIIASGAVPVVAAGVLGPWVLHGDLGRIVDVYQTLFAKDHHRLSELAWNLWWPADQTGDPRPGSSLFDALPFITYSKLGLGLSAVAALLALAYAVAKPGPRFTLIAAAYQAFAFYALPVSSHERYLYPFLALLLPVAVIDCRWLWLYVPVSVNFFLNLFVVAPPVPSWMDWWVYDDFTTAMAIVNIGLFAVFTAALASGVLAGSRRRIWMRTNAEGSALDAALTARATAVVRRS